MKINIFKKRKDKIYDESKKIETSEKNTKEYEYPIDLFRDWYYKLSKIFTKEELWQAWIDCKKFGSDSWCYDLTISETTISENKGNRKKIRKEIYRYLNKKIKENNFKISPSYYIENISHKKYEKILNESMTNLKKSIKKHLYKYEFSYEISTKNEKKEFYGVETRDKVNIPKLEKGDLVLLIKKDHKIINDEFSFLIIKFDKIVLFEYDFSPYGS